MNFGIRMEWLSDELRAAMGSNRGLFGIFGLGVLLLAGSIAAGFLHGFGASSGLPFGALSYQHVALQYAEAGNTYRAEQEYRAGQRINKFDSGAVLQLAETLRSARRYDAAFEALREGSANSLDSSLHVEFARGLAKRGFVAQSERVLRRAIAFDSENPLLRTHLGNFLLSSGDLDGAITAFEEALELNPGGVGAIDGLERVYASAPHLRAQRSRTGREGS